MGGGCLSLHLRNLLADTELRVAANEHGAKHARYVLVSWERSLLNAAQALSLSLAQDSRSLAGKL